MGTPYSFSRYGEYTIYDPDNKSSSFANQTLFLLRLGIF